MGSLIATILLVVLVILIIVAVVRSVRIVPQATAGIVERFGRYHRTLQAGLNIVTPFVDRLRPLIDLREQVVSFPPQPVITRDNLVVGIDTVIYFQSTVFRAIHEGNPDQRLLAYQYMQMLPQIAQGDANKVWIVPSEISKALEGIGGFFSGAGTRFAGPPAPEGNGAGPSGPGPELDASVGRHAGLEGWLTGGSGPVHDGAIGDHEGGSVPGAGDAGSAPLHDDPALMQGPTEMGAPV